MHDFLRGSWRRVRPSQSGCTRGTQCSSSYQQNKGYLQQLKLSKVARIGVVRNSTSAPPPNIPATRFHALRVVTSPAAPSSFTQTFHKPPIAPHNYTIMASAAKKKLVVCGGNGFLGKQHPQQPPASTQITANTPSSGSRICKAAAHRGWAVTSISRSGTPHWSSVSSSANPPDWSTSVSWQKGDVLDPASYTQHLDGADAVIHSMGILLEADYKGVVSGRESPIKGLQRAFSSKKQGTQNPLEGKGGEKLRPMESDGQLTYEVMNRDTGMFCMQGLFGF
jgi:hypothetical protein